MKTWIKIIIAFVWFILCAFVFFSPILIAALTGNWRMLFLFAVSWIPAGGLLWGLIVWISVVK